MLAMTATPIPRTLALAYFGDMDFSALREKPPGRQPIDTRAVNVERIDEVVAGLGRAIKTGARVYWVCPLVEGSEEIDLAAAQDRAEDLRKFFGAQGRPCPWPDEGPRQGRGDGGLLPRRDQNSRRHHGDRGRRQCARGDHHGDRTRRAFRPRAIASVARPGRARRRRNPPASCSMPARWTKPPRRGSKSCARPRTVFASRRRICACAAKARCWAPANPARRASRSPASTSTPTFCARRARTRRALLATDPEFLGERGRKPAAAALYFRARSGAEAAAGGIAVEVWRLPTICEWRKM